MDRSFSRVFSTSTESTSQEDWSDGIGLAASQPLQACA